MSALVALVLALVAWLVPPVGGATVYEDGSWTAPSAHGCLPWGACQD